MAKGIAIDMTVKGPEATPEMRREIAASIGKELGLKDEIAAVNGGLKKGGDSTFKAIVKAINAAGRVIMLPIIVFTAIIDGVWAGIRETVDVMARGMRQVDKDLSK